MAHSALHYPLAFIIVGLVLLILGRRLFWLFVAVAGFAAGIEAARYLLPHQSELFTLTVAIVLGVFGALLAVFLQKVAIAVGGFVAGGYLAVILCAPFVAHLSLHAPSGWLCFALGGILGAILMVVFFNWALIILSSLQGAHLVLRGLPPPHHYFPIAVVGLAIVGIAIQASTYRTRRVAVRTE